MTNRKLILFLYRQYCTRLQRDWYYLSRHECSTETLVSVVNYWEWTTDPDERHLHQGFRSTDGH